MEPDSVSLRVEQLARRNDTEHMTAAAIIDFGNRFMAAMVDIGDCLETINDTLRKIQGEMSGEGQAEAETKAWKKATDRVGGP